MSPGYGYSGIVIAMLAGLNPLGVRRRGDLRRRRARRRRQHEPRRRGADLHRRRHRRGVAAVDAGRDAVRALPAACCAGSVIDERSTSSLVATPTSGSAVLRIATPLIFGTLGVLLCERAGVLNLGIEGIMVAGAFAGWLAVYQGASLWTGVAVAALAGAAFGLLHAFLTVVARAVAARGGTRHHAVRDERCRTTRIASAFPNVIDAADDPAVRRDVGRADSGAGVANAADAARAALPCRSSRWMLYRTPLGLAVRMVGENPAAVEGQGIDVVAAAHRRRRRGLGADGRGRRVPDAVGVQRVLFQHGQRPRLDLRRARRVRRLAARQGARRRAAVRVLRRAAAAAAAAGAAAFRTSCT